MEELADQFWALADTVFDALWIYNEQGSLLEVNNRACELYGYTREELLGMNRAEFEPEIVPQYFHERFTAIVTSGLYRYKTCQNRKDGTLLFVEASTVYIPESRNLLEFTRIIT